MIANLLPTYNAVTPIRRKRGTKKTDNYDMLTIRQLKAKAKGTGIKNYGHMVKEELIQALRQYDQKLNRHQVRTLNETNYHPQRTAA